MSRQLQASPSLPPRWFIRSFWAGQRAVYSVTGGRLGLRRATDTQWGMLRLRTVGRRSGIERAAILGYWEDGADLVTMAMNGWADPEPAWWLNLQANPDATVDLPDGPRSVRARAAGADERPRLWARLAEYDKGLDAYAARRSRETAVVILSPRPAGGGMSADRKAAAAIGVLYIIGTAAFVLSAVVTAGALATNVSLDEVAARAGPVGGRHPARPAWRASRSRWCRSCSGRWAGATTRRWRWGMSCSAERSRRSCTSASRWVARAASRSAPSRVPDRSPRLVHTAVAVTSDQLLAIPFAVGALLFYVLLHRSRLVPRWLSAWGLVGCRALPRGADRDHVRARRSSSSWGRSPCRRWSWRCG